MSLSDFFVEVFPMNNRTEPTAIPSKSNKASQKEKSRTDKKRTHVLSFPITAPFDMIYRKDSPAYPVAALGRHDCASHQKSRQESTYMKVSIHKSANCKFEFLKNTICGPQIKCRSNQY